LQEQHCRSRDIVRASFPSSYLEYSSTRRNLQLAFQASGSPSGISWDRLVVARSNGLTSRYATDKEPPRVRMRFYTLGYGRVCRASGQKLPMELSPPRAESELRGRRRRAVVQSPPPPPPPPRDLFLRVKGWRKTPMTAAAATAVASMPRIAFTVEGMIFSQCFVLREQRYRHRDTARKQQQRRSLSLDYASP